MRSRALQHWHPARQQAELGRCKIIREHRRGHQARRLCHEEHIATDDDLPARNLCFCMQSMLS